MLFRVEADIAQPPERVFAFLRDLDQRPRAPSSVVPVLEKTSAGPYRVGSTFREVVRMLPRPGAWRSPPRAPTPPARFTRAPRAPGPPPPRFAAEVESEITRFEAPERLDYAFTWRLGPAELDGVLHYQLATVRPGVTHLVQTQTLQPRGLLRLLSPLIRLTFARQLARRLRALKATLEGRG